MKTRTPHLNGTIEEIRNYIFSNPKINLSKTDLEKSNYFFKSTYNIFNYIYSICKDLQFSKDLTCIINTDKTIFKLFKEKLLPWNVLYNSININTPDELLDEEDMIIKTVKKNIEIGKVYSKDELIKLFLPFKSKINYLNILKCFFTIKQFRKKIKNKTYGYIKIINNKPFGLDLKLLINYYHCQVSSPKKLKVPQYKKIENNKRVSRPSNINILTEIVITDNRTNELVFEGSIYDANFAGFKTNSILSTLTFELPIYLIDYKIELKEPSKNKNNINKYEPSTN